ncbi:hypothetical protein D1AOALGA4SA_9531 [Olavius algarvensis Delta 1 endosymbiont]|nr:hypothetical protein D1AOALGA4SA_9531 [Olavius algarvensis Delta 1 endosymbiont]
MRIFTFMRPLYSQLSITRLNGPGFLRQSKDPGPEDPALSSPQRGGVYLRILKE